MFISRFIKYFLITASLIFITSISSCNNEKDVCFSCVKTGSKAKAQDDPNTGPTTADFCDTEEKAYNTKLDYEAQGYVCSEK